jgi:hypothetical protein
MASAKAAIFSGDQRPDFSRSSGMSFFRPLNFRAGANPA